MKPVPITDEIKQLYPNTYVKSYSPPKDIAEEDCGTVEALVGTVHGGAFDGITNIRVYWKPDAEDLVRLSAGHEIELQIIAPGLFPHTIGVL